MKTSRTGSKRNGFVTILNVVIICSFMLTLMAIAYRVSIRSLEGQKKVQLQIDYDAREQAFLRSVVTLAPVYAANTMRNNSSGDIKASFDGMYQTAASWSNLQTARDADAKTALDFSAQSNGNTGDIKNGGDPLTSNDYVGQDGAADGVTPSAMTTYDAAYPPILEARDSVAITRSKSSPLISSDATYESSPSSSDVDKPRDFGMIPYPDIHFGYGTPGSDFIARQNWWKLYMHANKADGDLTGVGILESEYILSIYEIPAQLAISSSTFTNLGSSSWDSTKVSIEGPVYAKKANVVGAVVDNISTTEGVTGTIGTGAAQALGREGYEAANATAFYPISKASDYARSLFLPINTGLEFFDAFATPDKSYESASRLSRESWNNYTRGCHQCVMKLTVTETAGAVVNDQTPTTFTFTYQTSSGFESPPLTISKAGAGILWPDADDGEFPFISEVADNRSGIAIYLDRLGPWILSKTGTAIDFALNNSLVVNADYTQASVIAPAFPSTSNDSCVILRGCEDLTLFTDGFSLVTNYPLYLLEDFNQFLATGEPEEYPATSLFAPEIRYGEGDSSRLVVFSGQAGNLSTSGTAVDILDFKGSGDGNNVSGSISATLKPIESLDELPPVNVMNWLVVIQKKL